ncbi:hypothetical protein BP00DRAFT_206076 [Aspergillus indologenus CBS 114.80]|uniref:Uncharacterized protein n=1 Tax=Aspergillus indologenus CBS 114.80 TaxID=1450541 RepID=A0A2V5J0P2_9EURO|nr:hypothetical protein BP00DRAFT_206076 [Aspergillus indologenus CBS 114.80]
MDLSGTNYSLERFEGQICTVQTGHTDTYQVQTVHTRQLASSVPEHGPLVDNNQGKGELEVSRRAEKPDCACQSQFSRGRNTRNTPHEPIAVLLQMCSDIIDGSAWFKMVLIFAFIVTFTIYGLGD